MAGTGDESREPGDDQPPSDDERPDATDLRLLAALHAGQLVVALSGTLGITQYAVNKRIERLKRITGAENMFQLGAESARRFWLPTASDDPLWARKPPRGGG